MVQRSRKIRHLVGLLLAMPAIGTIAGCESPVTSTTDYRVEHRLTADERVFSLHLNVAENLRRFEPRDEANMRHFAREYMRRGRGPFLITTADGQEAASRRVFDAIAEVIVGEGVPGDQVYFQVRRGEKGSRAPLDWARLSFSGYYVRLPDCGDWSGETGFAPANRPHSDFGCSYQRNFGLMLSNPGDLKVSRQDAPTQATRTDYIVGTYASGSKGFGRPKPVNEQPDFSSVQ